MCTSARRRGSQADASANACPLASSYDGAHAKEIYVGWKERDDVCRAPVLLHPIKRVVSLCCRARGSAAPLTPSPPAGLSVKRRCACRHRRTHPALLASLPCYVVMPSRTPRCGLFLCPPLPLPPPILQFPISSPPTLSSRVPSPSTLPPSRCLVRPNANIQLSRPRCAPCAKGCMENAERRITGTCADRLRKGEE